jgi:hypothetical protein
MIIELNIQHYRKLLKSEPDASKRSKDMKMTWPRAETATHWIVWASI